MKVDVLLGLQWGDEGKGKIVDVLTPQYNVIARFQGGPNAGHTLKFNGTQFVLHTIPSGIFRENALNIIGNGVVIDPRIFKQEIDGLREKGFNLEKTLVISTRAHLITPTHIALDHAYEASKGDSKIGSTKKGIGPTYTDKVARLGLRVGDLSDNFEAKYKKLKESHMQILKNYTFDFDIEAYEKEWFKGIETMKSFRMIDSTYEVNELLSRGKSILAEGAQGTMLDVEFGSYPFVTSSNTITAGACTGLGVAPGKIGDVLGIFKAYCTRVGSGPFPTELFDATGEQMRDVGREYGSTTGRPRRCGWLDLVALKYSIMLNGATKLIMMKADVLSDLDTIKVCTSYIVDGKETRQFPYSPADVTPVYKEFKGWKKDITGCTSYAGLPAELKEYIEYIEVETGVPVSIVSVGPERDSTITR